MKAEPGGFSIDAVLCDSAVAVEGKLYVQGGGWNMLGSPNFPFVQSRIGLGVVLAVPYTETNRNHNLEIELAHEDGGTVPLGPPQRVEGATDQMQTPTKVTAIFNMGRPPIIERGDAQNMVFAVNFDQLRFESPGQYSFVLKVDGEMVERLTFRVISPVGLTINA